MVWAGIDQGKWRLGTLGMEIFPNLAPATYHFTSVQIPDQTLFVFKETGRCPSFDIFFNADYLQSPPIEARAQRHVPL